MTRTIRESKIISLHYSFYISSIKEHVVNRKAKNTSDGNPTSNS